VNDTMLSETQKVISLEESAVRALRLRKKPMNLCACDSEECENGVGVGVNDTMLSETLEVINLSESASRTLRLREKKDTQTGVHGTLSTDIRRKPEVNCAKTRK
jgi:hypothetical protein